MKYLFFIISITFSSVCFSQHADFTQNLNFSLSTNPAFAGTNNTPRIMAGYRNKYISLSSPFVSYYIAADTEISNIKSGIGLHAYREISGEGFFSYNYAGAIFSKTIPVSPKGVLKLSAEAGISGYGIETEGMTTQDMLLPGGGFSDINEEQFEDLDHNFIHLSAGALVYSPTIALGFSLKNLNQPGEIDREDYERHIFPLQLNAHLNLLFQTGNVDILPSVLIKTQRQSDQETFGIILIPKPLIAGIALNTTLHSGAESFSLIIGFMQKKYKFAYNCDLSLNPATSATFDTHEISFTFYPLKGREKPSAVNCPGL